MIWHHHSPTHPEVVVIGHSLDPSAETSMLDAGATTFVVKGDVYELVRAILTPPNLK